MIILNFNIMNYYYYGIILYETLIIELIFKKVFIALNMLLINKNVKILKNLIYIIELICETK